MSKQKKANNKWAGKKGQIVWGQEAFRFLFIGNRWRSFRFVDDVKIEMAFIN
jgi:hypothetical protein